MLQTSPIFLGLLVTISFFVALVACAVLRSVAARYQLLDRPNERSLHSAPVPRLGGVAIVLAACGISGLYAAIADTPLAPDVRMWFVAAVPVAAIGGIDDLRSVPASVRLLVQILVALAFVFGLGIPNSLAVAGGYHITLPGPVALALAVVWIVSVLNIYNFMDGMDGLAGTQGVSAALALAVGMFAHGHVDLGVVALIIAAACGGFLMFNMPPAGIFMGDAGSTFIGFSFAALGLVAARRSNGVPFVVAPLALAPFLLDGTFTLIRRGFRGEAVWRAHRSHLYQRAVQTGLGHRDVLMPYVGWMALAAAASMTAAAAGGLLTALAGAGLVGVLLGVWGWVAGRERHGRASTQ